MQYARSVFVLCLLAGVFVGAGCDRADPLEESISVTFYQELDGQTEPVVIGRFEAEGRVIPLDSAWHRQVLIRHPLFDLQEELLYDERPDGPRRVFIITTGENLPVLGFTMFGTGGGPAAALPAETPATASDDTTAYTLYVFTIDGVGERPKETVRLRLLSHETFTYPIDLSRHVLPRDAVLRVTGDMLDWRPGGVDFSVETDFDEAGPVIPLHLMRSAFSDSFCADLEVEWSASLGEGRALCGMPKPETFEYNLLLLRFPPSDNP